MKKMPPLTTTGTCMLIHGPTASGKTGAAITLEKPMLHLNREPKDPREVWAGISGFNPNWLTDGSIDCMEPEGYDDMLASLNELATRAEQGKCRYKSIYHDGLTFGNTNYKQAVEDDRATIQKASKNDADKVGVLIKNFDKLQKDWGVIASMMSRETFLLNKISKFGIVVVSTAQSTEYPKWNKTVRIAPSLIGQEFPKLIHGYFSYVGYIVQPFHYAQQEGKIIAVQPRVSFVSPLDEIGTGFSYLARCSCTKIAEAEARGDYAPLDYTKLMKVIRGN